MYLSSSSQTGQYPVFRPYTLPVLRQVNVQKKPIVSQIN